VVIAMIRGFARHTAKTIGNAWVDLTRITLYLLLPLSLVFAVFLVGQGVVQNFDAYQDVTTVEVTRYEVPKLDDAGQPLKEAAANPVTEAASAATQTLPMGPAASQIAIKQLGTNGGGFFNANSAHPFENPTPLSDFAQLLAILLIPAALCCSFGRMVGDTRQGWTVLAAMTIIFAAATIWTSPGPAARSPTPRPPAVPTRGPSTPSWARRGQGTDRGPPGGRSRQWPAGAG
jgi:potassium-transporting ATPase potassium-binding subunit